MTAESIKTTLEIPLDQETMERVERIVLGMQQVFTHSTVEECLAWLLSCGCFEVEKVFQRLGEITNLEQPS